MSCFCYETGLSLRVVTCNTCYVLDRHLMLLMKLPFVDAILSAKDAVQVVLNIMTAL